MCNLPPWFAKVRVKSNNMDTERRCSTCGKALEANAPGGLCPECLINADRPEARPFLAQTGVVADPRAAGFVPCVGSVDVDRL